MTGAPSAHRCAALIREPHGFISDGSDKRRCPASQQHGSRFCGRHKTVKPGSWKDGGWNPSAPEGGPKA